MKKGLMIFVYPLSIILVLLISSCSPSTTITKIYLQDIEVSGPINQSPVHITDSTQTGITISPRISFNTKKSLQGKVDSHTMVNSHGIFQMDTVINNDGTFYLRETPGANRSPFTGKNLTWNIAEITASMDFDFKLSRSFALFGGVNYSVVNEKPLWGGQFGLGLISSGKYASFRIDAGLNVQETPYEANTIVSVTKTSASGTSSYVIDYLDASKETNFSPFFNFTLNSSNPDWLLNIFFQAGYSIQNLVNFTPEAEVYHNPFYYDDVSVTEDLRGEAAAGLINITPGIFLNVGDTGRVLVGTRLYWIAQVKEVENYIYIMPLLQFDFNL